jgi:hypothetical protein
MKHLTLICFLAITTISLSQNQWSKDDRNNLYQEFLKIILTKNKSISQEQKESLALCCLNSTCEKYTKNDFNSKIDIETSRIFESQITLCAKNIGLELTEEKKQQEPQSESVLEWSKQDKSIISKDFATFLSKYDFLSDEEKDKLEYCFIKDITSKYSKLKYDELITLEIKQLQESITNRCAKSNKINLSDIKPIENLKKSPKDLLIGTWHTDKYYSIIFNENGTFQKNFKERYWNEFEYYYIKSDITSGEWFIDSKGVITINEKWIGEAYKAIGSKMNYINYSLSGKFKIEEITDDFFKLSLIEGQTCCKKRNDPTIIEIQGNKSKQ